MLFICHTKPTRYMPAALTPLTPKGELSDGNGSFKFVRVEAGKGST